MNKGRPPKPLRIKEMSDVDLGWLAGVLDSDGHIRMGKIQVGVTTPETTNKLAKITGINNISIGKRELPRRDLYYWGVYSKKDILYLAKKLLPIITVKHKRKALKDNLRYL